MAFRHWCNLATGDAEQEAAPGVAERPDHIVQRPRRSAAALMASAIAIRKGRRSMRPRVNLAPDPAITTEPVIQVYGARCMGWRGYLSLHTWIAVKPAAAKSYTIYEVTPEA